MINSNPREGVRGAEGKDVPGFELSYTVYSRLAVGDDLGDEESVGGERGLGPKGLVVPAVVGGSRWISILSEGTR
jgi:hypothetical protein